MYLAASGDSKTKGTSAGKLRGVIPSLGKCVHTSSAPANVRKIAMWPQQHWQWLGLAT